MSRCFYIGAFLLATVANAIYNHVDLLLDESFRKVDIGNGDLIQANRFPTLITEEMNMIVMMMTRCNAFFAAQCIFYDIVCAWDGMYDPLLQKSL